MNNLYEALEVCLNEIGQGADVDTVLFRYPELAAELRPILETSVKAKKMAVPAPSQEIVRRNRAKVLQHASELRERKSAPAHRVWSVPLRRMTVSFAVVAMLFASSTGLVRASSNTIPGDNLYPVKRTWEDVSLFFTFDPNQRNALELEHETERLGEVHELFTQGRSVSVDFSGYVTRQSGTEWRIANVTVVISPKTILPGQQIQVGNAVRVQGQTKSDMSIDASQIELVSPGTIVPDVKDDESENGQQATQESNQTSGEDSGNGSEGEATVVPTSKTPVPTKVNVEATKTEGKSIEGKVVSIENDFIVVNGILMDIATAQVKGSPSIGAAAKVEGYYDVNGVFIVTKIEFEKSGPNAGSGGSGSGNENGTNTNTNTNTNSNSNSGGSNDNGSNSNSNSNSNDSGGGGGSGGGGND
jgi:hypothetical protein